MAYRAQKGSREKGRNEKKRKVSKGASANVKSFWKEHPWLLRQWHPEKNPRRRPTQHDAESSQRVWWRCDEYAHHEWLGTVQSRLGRKHGCPFCSGRVVPYEESLQALDPAIARTWHPTLNEVARPDEVSPGSDRRVFWQCPRGPDHVWSSQVKERVLVDCPFCSNRRASVTNSLAHVAPEVARWWHPTKNGALTPWDVAATTSREVWWKCEVAPDHEFRDPVSVRRDRKGCPICAHRRFAKSESLATENPAFLRLWHPTKNGKLTPAELLSRSTRRVWWQCDRVPEHEWQARVYNLYSKGCPLCRKVRRGTFEQLHPELARQWHPTKNGKRTPSTVQASSTYEAYWKCPKGTDHVWKAKVRSRAGGSGCPFCSGRRPSAGANLAAALPQVAACWHPTKNGKLTPRDVRPGAGSFVWWKCPKGPDHEWEAEVFRHAACPFCANKRVSVTNCVATRFPRLAAQWHPRRNGNLTPRAVRPTSPESVWWKCPKGPDHEWQATVRVRSRSVEQTGQLRCPFCLDQLVSSTNCLQRRFPKIARQWHPERNRGVTARDVIATSRERAYWKCPRGHEYRAAIRDRTVNGLGCPRCGSP